jgi:uncharacterized membrane protein YqaE (UPF0057 family)
LTLLEIILSVLVPPVGVFLRTGLSVQFLLNILLTAIGYVPGVIHAVWIITRP